MFSLLSTAAVILLRLRKPISLAMPLSTSRRPRRHLQLPFGCPPKSTKIASLQATLNCDFLTALQRSGLVAEEDLMQAQAEVFGLAPVALRLFRIEWTLLPARDVGILTTGGTGLYVRAGLLTELRQEIRDVRQGPDGLIYLVTRQDAKHTAKSGMVLRIEPAE